MQKLAPVLSSATLLRYRSRVSLIYLFIEFPKGALNRNSSNSVSYYYNFLDEKRLIRISLQITYYTVFPYECRRIVV